MRRETVIGGMTAEDYDPEKDPSGAIGHALANILYHERGPVVFRKSLFEQDAERRHWEVIGWAALRDFSPLGEGESVTSNELSLRLRDIGRVGYSVGSYRGMSKVEKELELERIRREVGEYLGENYPDIMGEIRNSNSRKRRGIGF